MERYLEGQRLDRARRLPADNGDIGYLFTEKFDETNWGGTFQLEYALAFEGGFTVGPQLGMWWYEGGNVVSYGLRAGVPIGKALR